MILGRAGGVPREECFLHMVPTAPAPRHHSEGLRLCLAGLGLMVPSTPQSIVEETLWLTCNFSRCFKEKLTNGSCYFPGDFRFPFALLFFFSFFYDRLSNTGIPSLLFQLELLRKTPPPLRMCPGSPVPCRAGAWRWWRLRAACLVPSGALGFLLPSWGWQKRVSSLSLEGAPETRQYLAGN